MLLEKVTGSAVEKFVLSDLKTAPTVVAEFGLYRFSVESLAPNIEVFVGNVKLRRFEDVGVSIFFMEHEKQNSYFAPIFLNQLGFVTIEIWSSNVLQYSYYVEISSTKISQTDLEVWIN